jgi:hypothetical protein
MVVIFQDKELDNRMLRRNPTRIEVKLDDLEEYNQMKKDKELEQGKQKLVSLIDGLFFKYIQTPLSWDLNLSY